MVRTWYFHCRGMSSVPDWGTKIPHAKKYCVCVCRAEVGVLFKTCKQNFSEGFLRASICLLP